VVACDHDYDSLNLINTAARFAARPFYAAGIHGYYGFIFADLVRHEYTIEREQSNQATRMGPETITRSVIGKTDAPRKGDGLPRETVKKQEIYCPLILANTSSLHPSILSRPRMVRRVPQLLPCLRALFDFQQIHKRSPKINNQDLALFTTLAKTKCAELQLPAEILTADFLRSFTHSIDAEIVATAAFIGARLSQDVINVLGKREQPIQNFAFFDGDSLEGSVY
jgi:ubiquitin-like 1-activating enzyme E1 A